MKGNNIAVSYTLPICKTPLVENNFLGMQLCVFQSYKQNLMPVIINHFTNIVMGKNQIIKYSHLYDDKWFIKEKIMHKHNLTYHNEMWKSKADDLIKLVIEFISNDYYLYGSFNSYYISAKQACQFYEVDTKYLIYSYNLEDRIFHVVGKTKDKIFDTYTIQFDEFIKGVLNHNNEIFGLNFIKFNENCQIKTNYSKIYNGVYDYIHSKNKDDGIIPEGRSKNYCYGLDCYRDFLKSLTLLYEYKKYIEPADYSTFLEHHIIMQKRIEYLTKVNVIRDVDLLGDYNSICETVQKVYSNCLRYNDNFNPQIIKEIYNDVAFIIKEEEQVLKVFLAGLKEYISCCKINTK